MNRKVRLGSTPRGGTNSSDMRKKIVLLNESLHTKCSDVKEGEDVSSLIENLFDTLKTTTGVGLAAPQIGDFHRVFVSNYYDPFTKVHDEAFINPVIVSHSEETVTEFEGCLSVPGISEQVERYAEVTVSYLDASLTGKTVTFKGLMSRIVQHEIDHLNGVVFIDKLPKVRVRKIRRKLAEIIARILPSTVTYEYT